VSRNITPPQNEADSRRRSTVALESIADSLLTAIEIVAFAVKGIYEGMKNKRGE
jgi:hypothetical protein